MLETEFSSHAGAKMSRIKPCEYTLPSEKGTTGGSVTPYRKLEGTLDTTPK